MYQAHDLLVYFLCRLKINHDSHEFILEINTVANSTVYLRMYSKMYMYLLGTSHIEFIFIHSCIAENKKWLYHPP